MNIKILDSWLRDYLKTKASPREIAKNLSLTSVSIERVEPYKQDVTYDIEVTTNRPDLASVIGLAIEAATVLPQSGIDAKFEKPTIKLPAGKPTNPVEITIKNDPKLVRRICAVVMEVHLKESPEYVKDRLESSDIRSLNNIIDVTNYVMREVGHPTHVFDYDRLMTKTLIIRESEKGEKVKTLDGKEYQLPGGDIVADNGEGEIVDLLGVMGTANSVVTHNTKRVLYFIDNVEPNHIRKTSMTLGIRTEAAVLNEKDIDTSLTMDALVHGIELFKKIANAKIVSDIIDIYPSVPKPHSITITKEKIQKIIGVEIQLKKSAQILTSLGFKVKATNNKLIVTVPSWRAKDVTIPEDIVEEIARVYGYHNIPSKLPYFETQVTERLGESEFYWEQRIKVAMKYWGFTELYTYSFVSEDLFEGPIEHAVTVANPLNEEFIYMRKTLVPSLLKAVSENKNRETIQILEIANVYDKKPHEGLPDEKRMFAGIIRKPKVSFFEVKGYIEQLANDLGIHNLKFKPATQGDGADIYITHVISKKERQRDPQQEQNERGISPSALQNRNDKTAFLGSIEILDESTIDFELSFDVLRQEATLKKVYSPITKFPPIIEDLAIIADEKVLTGELVETIKEQSQLIVEVSLLDQYEATRTFHILYQHPERNLTNEEVGEIREKILQVLKEKFDARLKD